MSDQFIAIELANAEARRRRRFGLTLLRFDFAEDIEICRSEHGGDEPDAELITTQTARRLMSGRTVVVESRVAAERLGAEFFDLDPDEIVPLDEFGDLFGDAADLTVQPGVRALATRTRAILSSLGRYDTPTLSRISSLAKMGGWSISRMVDAALAEREANSFAFGGDEQIGSHEIAFLSARERPEPLRRTGENEPMPTGEIGAMLDRGGALSHAMPGFERRQAQREMAEAIVQAFNDDQWLLVEAGTGTGKSLAYLAPAARFARQRGERVVISTNTKALQDQLISKDIPDLQRALAEENGGEPVKAVVLKGRANYLCLRRWFAQEKQPLTTPEDARFRARVNLWLPITEAGDRAELRLTGDEEMEFGRVSAEGEVCNAQKCVYQQRNRCFLFRARRNAENAHLVVVNHALLLSDTGDGAAVIPDYERLVIDEAHHLEDQATSQFGMTLHELAVLELVDQFTRFDGPILTGLLPDATALLSRSATDEQMLVRSSEARDRLEVVQQLATRVRSASLEFFSRARSICDAVGLQETGYARTLRVVGGMRSTAPWGDMERELDRLNAVLGELEDQGRWFLGSLHEQAPDHDDEETTDPDDPFENLSIELSSAIDGALELSATITEFVLSPSPDRVYWFSLSANVNRLSLNAAPLHVGEMLRATLFERMRSLVLTSATLTTDRTFTFLKDRLSCKEAEELALESPFNYRASALLYIADDIPEPNQAGYQQMMEQVLIELGETLRGRTLVLFTSHSALRQTHRAIKPLLAARGINVLAQRADGSPRQLIEQFRSTSHTMLLGTATFWEGVDVVGEALSALVIAKLPFAVPTDPVVAARSEQFEDPFREYSIPQAVLRFKQGFGRLIRSSSDRGVCVVLDRRTISKRYGSSFTQSLPRCTVQIGATAEIPEAASTWLQLDDHDPGRGDDEDE